MKNKVIVVVGPTAVGKTKIAIELAKYLNIDIISGDSIAVFKRLDIGSAKPTIEEMDGVKHHLIDIKEPNEDYSVADFQRDARSIIDKNELNLICGGTGLYIQSVIFDYKFEAKKRDDEIKDLYSNLSNEELFKLLLEKDPNIDTNKIHQNNRKRVLRAIEIYLESGKRKSDIIAEQEHKLLYDVKFIGLSRESRDELYSLIDKRVLKMFEEGLLDEVKSLIDRHDPSLRAFQAIGYKEIIEGLKNNETLDNIISLIQKNTRNYAKRQYTYFRNQLPVNWFNSKEEAYNFMEENGG